MKLISEEAQDIEFLTEASKDGSKSYFIEGVFMQAETKNRNGRVYPKAVLQKEAKRYSDSFIKTKRAFGELGHPDGPTVNLERVSHMIEELEEVDNNFMGRAKILDTPYGKIVKKTRKLHVHDDKFDSKIGDTVKIMETKPMSKTKRCRVTEVIERAR